MVPSQMNKLPFKLSLQKLPVNVRYPDTAIYLTVPENLRRMKKNNINQSISVLHLS